MIGAIRSATVSTFKWGVSLIGPAVVTKLAIDNFKGLRQEHNSFPSARSGIIGLSSFALLRSLTGCGWKTALVASSVIPIFIEITRRRFPPIPKQVIQSLFERNGWEQGNYGGVRDVRDKQPSSQVNRRTTKAQAEKYIKSLVETKHLQNFIKTVFSRIDPTVRFRELNEDQKGAVWSDILLILEKSVHRANYIKLPFLGYARENLFLISHNSVLKLQAVDGESDLWSIELNRDTILSNDPRTQMYIELLIAKHTFFEQGFVDYRTAFVSLIDFFERSVISRTELLHFTMFNNVLAPHDLTFHIQSQWVDSHGKSKKTVSLAKQSRGQPNHSSNLEIVLSKLNDPASPNTKNYEITMHLGDRKPLQRYTFTNEDSQWHMTYNQKTYELNTILDQLTQESDWDLDLNQEHMRTLFDMIQMVHDFLNSPYTVVFHNDSKLLARTDGKAISYEALQRIATYTNEAPGQSVIRFEGDRLLVGSAVIQKYELWDDEMSESDEEFSYQSEDVDGCSSEESSSRNSEGSFENPEP